MFSEPNQHNVNHQYVWSSSMTHIAIIASFPYTMENIRTTSSIRGKGSRLMRSVSSSV